MAIKTTAPLRKIRLYQFSNFDMVDFVERYLKIVNPHEEIDPGTLSVYTLPSTKRTKARIGARSEAIIENKCRYLQDAIIRRANSKKDSHTFTLNSNILKAVIRNDYKPLLEVLIDMGYIEMGDGTGGKETYNYYQYGSYSHIYTLKNTDVYLTEPFINKTIQSYKEKTIEEIKAIDDKYTYQPIREKYGEPFLKRYMTSLRLIRIEDEDGLLKKIEEKQAEKEGRKLYYRNIVDELKQKDRRIYKVDDSGRIYHILTNLDRELKQYLSIDITLDIKNSHPLLINYFIFNKLNIDNTIGYNISKFLGSYKSFIKDNDNHNVGRKLRMLLNINSIEMESVAKLSDSDLEYIYLTSTGQLWDEITKRHPMLSRNDVKVEMFKSVYYPKSPVSDRWSSFASEFKAQFPDVYALIAEWKRKKNVDMVVEYMRSHGLPIDKGTSSLSIAMMALESSIFTAILKRLYAKKWNAVHIHDCIVIPKGKDKNHPTVEQIQQIMMEVYQEFGLYPSFG